MAVANFLHIILMITVIDCAKFNSLDKAYQKGLKAYTGERWSECIAQFEEALQLHKLFKSVVNNCRQECVSKTDKTEIDENIEDLRISEMFFNRRHCVVQCKDKRFQELHIYSDVEEATLNKIQRKKPYQYLHVCYFQMSAWQKAASAAYTYLLEEPSDEQMQKNLKYYLEQPEVNEKEVIDLESEDYEILHNLGMRAYENHNWGETVSIMEQVLMQYLASENMCRTECETQPGQESSSEFSITVANLFASLLQCKQQCQNKLNILKYNSGLEFLSDILNYLQISYYHLGNNETAASTVETILMMFPDDEDMLSNKNIYKTLVNAQYFRPRQDILFYMKRDQYEKKLLEFFHNGHNDLDNNSLSL